MRRLAVTFALICVLSQIPLPFVATKKADAAVLRNLIPLNITIPKDASNNKEVVNWIGTLDKTKDADDVVMPFGYSKFGTYIRDMLDKYHFLTDGVPELPPGTSKFFANYYPMNDGSANGSLGDGFAAVKLGPKGTTSFGAVVTIYLDLGNYNETAGESNLYSGIIGKRDEADSSTHGIFLGLGKNTFPVNEDQGIQTDIDGKDLIGLIGGSDGFGKELTDAGFKQIYNPRFIDGKIDFSIPGAQTKWNRNDKIKYTKEVTAYNVKSYLIRQPSALKNKTAWQFQVPITGLQPKTKYTAQIYIDENDADRIGYSQTISFTTLEKNADGTDNYGTYEKDKPLDQQLDDVKSDINADAQDDVNANIIGELLTCSWTKPLSWFKGCMVIAFHDIIYRASAKVLEIGAKLMDIFIGFSISNFFYSDNIGIILNGWRIVRDVSNLLFIFILLWTAFNIILKVNHNFNAKKVITNVIIIGLLINFSLFFTRVIIDAGNIGARVFYNAITVQGKDDVSQIDIAGGSSKGNPQIKSLSGSITKGLGLYNMIDSPATQRALEGNSGLVFMVLLLGTVMNIVAAWTFFICGFFFVGRIISLWAAIIFSPIAFTSSILPELTKLPKIGWGKWLNNLLNASFGALFFMFFLFLIIQFCQSPILSDISENMENGALSGGTLFAIILLQFIFIIGLIKASKSIAEMMAGEFGAGVAAGFEGLTKFAAGAVIAISAGTIAKGGQAVLGGRATSWLNSAEGNTHKLASAGDRNSLNALRSSNSRYANKTDAELRAIAQKKVEAQQRMSKRSFDIRNTGAANMLTKGTGIDLNAAAALGGLTGIGLLKATDVEQTAGGFQAQVDRKAYKQKQYLDSLNLNEEEKKRLEEELKELTDALADAKRGFEGTVEMNERLAKQLAQRIQARGGGATTAEQAQLQAYQNATNQAKERLDRHHANADPRVRDIGNRIEEIKRGVLNPLTNQREGGLDQVSRSAMRMYQDFLTRTNAAHNTENLGSAVAGSWANRRNIFAQGSFLRGLGQLAKNLPKAVLEGIKTGIVGMPLGIGGVAGLGVALDEALLGGGFLKSFKTITLDEAAGNRRAEQQALHAIASGHIHEPHAKATYKSPSQNIFNIFSGGSSGGSGHSSSGAKPSGGGGH